MTKSSDEWPHGDEAYYPYLTRLGRERDGEDRSVALRWALSLVDKPGGWNGLTPGDRQNLRMEIGCFAGSIYQTNNGRVLPIDDIPPPPTEKEVQQVLLMFDEMLWAAIRREPVVYEDVRGKKRLVWRYLPGVGERYDYEFHFSPKRRWLEMASIELTVAIHDYGHLLKLCPAPASRGKDGEVCDTRFVASRPNQAYCSARCQTRAATRAYRSGDSTPVAKMLAAKDRESRKSKKGV